MSEREQALWRRGITPIVSKYQEEHKKVMSEIAGRGFSALPGYAYDIENSIELNTKINLSELNFKILSDTTEREIKQAGIDYYSDYKTALMDSALVKKYQKVEHAFDTYWFCKLNNKWGLIDENGKEFIPPIYLKLEFCPTHQKDNRQIFFYATKKSWGNSEVKGVIDINNRIMIAINYKDVRLSPRYKSCSIYRSYYNKNTNPKSVIVFYTLVELIPHYRN